jgi:hypothetical protein
MYDTSEMNRCITEIKELVLLAYYAKDPVAKIKLMREAREGIEAFDSNYSYPFQDELEDNEAYENDMLMRQWDDI